MATGKEHQNKPLISITDGKKLGEVKDLYLAADLADVRAVLAGTEGLLSRKYLVIERAHIQVYGEDAWLVAGSDKVVNVESIAESSTFLLMSDLRGRDIDTDGGTKIGVVEDVILDAEARVLGFSLGKVYVQGPLAERKTIARGAITGVGDKNSPMTTVLAQAESMPVAAS